MRLRWEHRWRCHSLRRCRRGFRDGLDDFSRNGHSRLRLRRNDWRGNFRCGHGFNLRRRLRRDRRRRNRRPQRVEQLIHQRGGHFAQRFFREQSVCESTRVGTGAVAGGHVDFKIGRHPARRGIAIFKVTRHPRNKAARRLLAPMSADRGIVEHRGQQRDDDLAMEFVIRNRDASALWRCEQRRGIVQKAVEKLLVRVHLSGRVERPGSQPGSGHQGLSPST